MRREAQRKSGPTATVAIGLFQRLHGAERAAQRLRELTSPSRVMVRPLYRRVRSTRIPAAPLLAVGLGALTMAIAGLGATLLGVPGELAVPLAVAAGVLAFAYGIIAGALVGRGRLADPAVERGHEVEYEVVVSPETEARPGVVAALRSEGAADIHTREVTIAA